MQLLSKNNTSGAEDSPIAMRGLVMTSIALLDWRTRLTPHKAAVTYHEEGIGWKTLTWKEFSDQVTQLASGFSALGVRQGDRVAIAANTSCAWAMVDFAIQAAGGITVAIHPQYSTAEMRHVVEETRPLIFCCDELFLQHFSHDSLNVAGNASIYSLGRAVKGIGVIGSLDEIRTAGRNSFNSEVAKLVPEDIATIVFSSGSTGMPKAICLSHRNLVSTARAAYEHFGHLEARSLHWLPFAHMFGRIGFYIDIVAGSETTFSRGVEFLREDIHDARPTILFMVPKALNRIRTELMSNIDRKARPTRVVFGAWMSLATNYLKGESRVNAALFSYMCLIVKKTLLRKIHRHFGGALKVIIVGGAPVDATLVEFFEGLGIAVREGFGMTETTGVALLQPFASNCLGNVGSAIPSISFTLANDGELLLKGHSVCQQYLNAQHHSSAFTIDGWLKTGDLAKVHTDGTLSIIGRKKDVIITEGGENITPHRIEDALRKHQNIKEAIVCGNGRPYLVALLIVDSEAILSTRVQKHTNTNDLNQVIQRIVDAVNNDLAKFEQVRRFAILDEALSIETGTMTVTQKPRRDTIEHRYRHVLDNLYSQAH